VTRTEKLERERDTARRVAEEAMRLLTDEQLLELRAKLDNDEPEVDKCQDQALT
jgi:hypothetical protein